MDITENTYIEQERTKQRYEFLQGMGDCYLQIDDYIQAQQCYEKAAVLEPDEPDPYVGLGVVALQKSQFEDAETAFRVACRLDRNCAKAYSGLAMVAQQKDDYELAFEMYLKCLELDTDNLAALLGLFQTSCQMGTFSNVIHYLKVYLQMHPDDTAVMFSLASLYIKEAQFEKAKQVFIDLTKLQPQNKDAANLLEEIEHNLAKLEKQKVTKT
jgi:tetratricopeptide (TPR) repeat protein